MFSEWLNFESTPAQRTLLLGAFAFLLAYLGLRRKSLFGSDDDLNRPLSVDNLIPVAAEQQRELMIGKWIVSVLRTLVLSAYILRSMFFFIRDFVLYGHTQLHQTDEIGDLNRPTSMENAIQITDDLNRDSSLENTLNSIQSESGLKVNMPMGNLRMLILHSFIAAGLLFGFAACAPPESDSSSSTVPYAGTYERLHSIWKWDSEGSKWMAYSPEQSIAEELKSKGFESFSIVNAGEGFWVRMSKDNLPESMSVTEPPSF